MAENETTQKLVGHQLFSYAELEKAWDELKALTKGNHDDSQDAAASAFCATEFLGAFFASQTPQPTEETIINIPREQDIFKPTKSMLDTLSERIGSDLDKWLTDFGNENGFPVAFVFYQTLKNEDGVSKATCDIKTYKFHEFRETANFARRNYGELGIFQPQKSKEV